MLKECPACGWSLVLLSSQNTKYCVECKMEIPWVLNENQESIYGDRRKDLPTSDMEWVQE